MIGATKGDGEDSPEQPSTPLDGPLGQLPGTVHEAVAAALAHALTRAADDQRWDSVELLVRALLEVFGTKPGR